MARGRMWLRKAATLLALCAGGVGASATPQLLPAPAAAWQADPDDQFLLDVIIRQLKLGDGVRAYNAPEGTCVVLGDFLTTLDVPMSIDLAAKRASGWAFRENNRITIDYAAMTAAYGAKSETIAPGVIRETPEGWCVQTSALTRWFGISVKPVTSGSALVLESDTKLPVELAAERINGNLMTIDLSTSALAAAIASLNDEAFMAFSKNRILEGRGMILDAVRKVGLEALPTQANFVFVRVHDANVVKARMAERGIVIRGTYGKWTQWSRVSTGKIEDVRRYAAALPEVVRA